ncbi:UNVERIFIED_CONTAM: protein SRG1 [Sesamum calycinum]|uniref:Protein SRG1 n=1 Tax=Sesamum calycinum TaxID=2727403 RepID=A0AAW2JUW1_9LAMI
MQQGEGLGNGISSPVKISVQEPKSSEIRLVSDDDVPVIDFSLLGRGDEGERKKLDVACQEWGFFQIINHGAEEAIPKMKATVIDFYDLPLSEKNKYAMPPDYFEGYSQDNKVGERKRDWYDILWLLTMPPHSRNTKYWPLTVPGFKESVEEYATQVQRVTYEILGNLSLLMRVERDVLKELHGEVKQGTRLNYYPACARPDLVFALSPHHDYTSISFVLQEDDITALQIKHKEMWVPVKPIPNAISVLVGDVLESWSNGKYKGLEHRVVANVEKPRISVISFVIPSDEAELNPLKTMVDDDHPPIYKNGVKYIDYLLYANTKETEEDKYVNNIEYLKREI